MIEKNDENEEKRSRSRSRSESRNGSVEKDEKEKRNYSSIKNFDAIREYLQESRDQFVFKITFEGDVFYEKNAKNYIISLLKNKSDNPDNFEILEYKKITVSKPKQNNYLWFKINQNIKVKSVYFKSSRKNDLAMIKIQQLRCDHFIEDID